MLAPVLSAALSADLSRRSFMAKAEAFPVEVEVNCGWGDTLIVMLSCNLPVPSQRPIAVEKRRCK
jgi:hypothetical protein